MTKLRILTLLICFSLSRGVVNDDDEDVSLSSDVENHDNEDVSLSSGVENHDDEDWNHDTLDLFIRTRIEDSNDKTIWRVVVNVQNSNCVILGLGNMEGWMEILPLGRPHKIRTLLI